MASASAVEISREFVSMCPICGEKDRWPLYKCLKDRLFDVPGEWNLDYCANCSCAYLSPRPTYADIGKVYTGAYAVRKPITNLEPSNWKSRLSRAVVRGFLANTYGYIRDVRLWERVLGALVYLSPYRREQLSYKVLRLPYKADGCLLDVGCGNGDFLIQMSGLGWRTEGIDTDPKMVRLCRERGLNVREGTLESQNYPEDSFDAITVKHVIEHVHDPLSFLTECARILKPGGRLIVLTPNLGSIGHRLFRDAWLGLDSPRHLVIFTSGSLLMTAQKAGLKVIAVSSTTRITRFNWRVSYEVKVRKRTSYSRRTSADSLIVEHASDLFVRLASIWNKNAGDELALLATK